jgi:hypothetical protein
MLWAVVGNDTLLFHAMGAIPNMLNQSLTTLNLPLCQVQKVGILNTCSIMRKFLSDEVHFLTKRLITPNHVSSPCS